MNDTLVFENVIRFLNKIGLIVQEEILTDEQCFLPGLMIHTGNIIIDRNKLRYPGDILHEAGHLAVVPSHERQTLNGPEIGKRTDAPAEEMMAIAWSYAACIHLNIEPGYVFHDNGYKNGGKELVENFNNGNYFGVPVLEWLGMTSTNNDSKVQYPQMIKWLRD